MIIFLWLLARDGYDFLRSRKRNIKGNEIKTKWERYLKKWGNDSSKNMCWHIKENIPYQNFKSLTCNIQVFRFPWVIMRVPLRNTFEAYDTLKVWVPTETLVPSLYFLSKIKEWLAGEANTTNTYIAMQKQGVRGKLFRDYHNGPWSTTEKAFQFFKILLSAWELP